MSAARALAQPARATAAIARPARRSDASPPRAPIASLSAIPAHPAVQRKCTACEAEERERLPVQPRLEVGPAGDAFEREADGIAGRIMAMPESEVSSAGPTVQRACAACEAEDKVQRASLGEDDDELARRASETEEDNGVRARREGADPAAEEGLAASAAELTGGGSPLPEATRRFYEPRLGRDLSGVRLHRGARASRLNSSIAARAFTYQDHIWLGPREGTGPSFTMAHELAHVMQQTSPGPVGPVQARPSARAGLAGGRVQRIDLGTYYYQEKGVPLPDSHDEVVRWLTKQDKDLYGEVPVPNAKASGLAMSKKGFGRADLANFGEGGVPVGMASASCRGDDADRWYCGPDADGKLRRPTSLDEAEINGEVQSIIQKGWAWGKHDKLSRPRFGDVKSASPKVGFVRDAGGVEKAAKPSETRPSATIPPLVETPIQIGDVKAGAFYSARRKALGQITSYFEGFGEAQKAYAAVAANVEAKRAAMKKAGANDFSSLPPALTPWKVKVSLLSDIAKVGKIARVTDQPRELQAASYSVDASGVLKTVSSEKREKPLMGHLYVWKETDSSFAGAWSYLWAPDDDPKAREHKALEADTTQTGLAESADCLRDAVTLTPETQGKPAKTRPLPSSPASEAPGCIVRKLPEARSAPPLVQRDRGKVAPSKPAATDPFDTHYKAWQQKQEALQRGAGTYYKTGPGEQRLALLHELEARRNTAEAVPDTRLKQKLFSDKDKTTLATNEKTQFWIDLFASPRGAKVGRARHGFGSIFVKLVGAAVRAKEKVAQFLAKLAPKSPGSGLGGTALKMAATILGTIGRYLFPKVAAALMSCVERGFETKLDEMFKDGPVASLQAQIARAEAFADELQSKVLGEIENLAEGIKAKLASQFESIKETAAFIKDLADVGINAIRAVRVGICVAGGVETLGAACVVAALDGLLGLFGLSPIERLAGRLLRTCRGQRLVAEGLYAFNAVKTLPTDIANWIIDHVRPMLPGPAQEFLCKPNTIKVDLPNIRDVTCGHGGSPEAEPGPDFDGNGAERFKLPPDLEILRDKGMIKRAQEMVADGRQQPLIAPQKPAQPPPQPPQPPPQQPKPAGGGGQPSKGEGEAEGEQAPGHGVEKGTFEREDKSVTVKFFITGNFGLGKHNEANRYCTWVSAVDSEKTQYGPDEIEITVREVKKTTEGLQVTWAAINEYRLYVGEKSIILEAGRYVPAKLEPAHPPSTCSKQR